MGTAYLFDKISKGSTLTFKGPEGNFILPQNLESTQLIMVCTGTGIAPFRSMIQEVTLKQIPFLRMHLIFGARKVEDILYREEMENWLKYCPIFPTIFACPKSHHGRAIGTCSPGLPGKIQGHRQTKFVLSVRMDQND